MPAYKRRNQYYVPPPPLATRILNSGQPKEMPYRDTVSIDAIIGPLKKKPIREMSLENYPLAQAYPWKLKARKASDA